MNPFSSLGGKLLLAFLLIAGLPAMTGLFGWIELGAVSRNQSRVINETIPAIAEVRGYTEETARIVAVAPELATVTTEAARVDRTAFLTAQVDALSARLDRFAAIDAQNATGLVRTVAQIRQDITALDAMVQQRIALEQTEARELQQALKAADNLIGVADTLVANAEMSTSATISDLYDMSDTDLHPQARLEALDKLIEVDLFELGLMTEMRSRTAEAGLLMNRIPGLATPQDLADLQAQLAIRVDIVARRVREIRDPQRAAQARDLLTAMRQDDRAATKDGLFETAGAILAVGQRIAALQGSLRRSAKALDDQAALLANAAQDHAEAAGTEAMGMIRTTQLSYGWAAVVVLAISLAVLWFYIRGNIIRRIDRLSDWMTSLAGGALDLHITPRGNDEITRMERAFEVFRQQSLANRALQAEKSRTLDELRMHRRELQRLVAEQTETLRAEVAAHDAARAKAESADRAKSEFLAMMSHEIRTPMNGVLGMIRSMARDKLTPRQQTYLHAAEVSGEGLMTILNDVLDYSKFEIGGTQEIPVVFDLAKLLDSISTLMRAAAGEKGLTLRVTATGLPQAVLGDMAKLRQILFNLLSNAIKFTDAGEISLSVSPMDDRYNFVVSDNGPGIRPESQQRIFQAFEQEDAMTTRRYGGTGLGLAICTKFAEAMQGTLTVQSTPGLGAAFTLTVPLTLADPALLPPDPHAKALRHEGPSLRILVVEDNAINQLVTHSFLEQMGHTAIHAGSAEAALALLQGARFDAVLMDVNLPGMSGQTAARMIRNHADPAIASLLIIGISAHVQPEDVAAQLEAGMDDFVAKPISPERLAAALARKSHPAPPGVTQAALDWVIADLGSTRAASLARLFIGTLDAETKAMQMAAKSHDSAALYNAAHRLKGAAGNFALQEFVDCVNGIEAKARIGVVPSLQSFEVLAEKVRDGMAALLAELEPSQAQP